MHYEGIVLREACSWLIVVGFAGNREPDLNILLLRFRYANRQLANLEPDLRTRIKANRVSGNYGFPYFLGFFINDNDLQI